MIIIDRNTVAADTDECFCDVDFVCELHEFDSPRENVYVPDFTQEDADLAYEPGNYKREYWNGWN